MNRNFKFGIKITPEIISVNMSDLDKSYNGAYIILSDRLYCFGENTYSYQEKYFSWDKSDINILKPFKDFKYCIYEGKI